MLNVECFILCEDKNPKVLVQQPHISGYSIVAHQYSQDNGLNYKGFLLLTNPQQANG